MAVHLDNGILFSIQRYELSHYEKTWRKLKCIFLSNRSQSGRLHTVLYQPDDILEEAKLWRVKKISSCKDVGREE